MFIVAFNAKIKTRSIYQELYHKRTKCGPIFIIPVDISSYDPCSSCNEVINTMSSILSIPIKSINEN